MQTPEHRILAAGVVPKDPDYSNEALFTATTMFARIGMRALNAAKSDPKITPGHKRTKHLGFR